jgi:hypothetical protein
MVASNSRTLLRGRWLLRRSAAAHTGGSSDGDGGQSARRRRLDTHGELGTRRRQPPDSSDLTTPGMAGCRAEQGVDREQLGTRDARRKEKVMWVAALQWRRGRCMRGTREPRGAPGRQAEEHLQTGGPRGRLLGV